MEDFYGTIPKISKQSGMAEATAGSRSVGGPVLLSNGVASSAGGQQNRTLQALKESVRFDTQNVGYRTHYGWVLGETGQWPVASQQFQEVSHQRPRKKRMPTSGLAQSLLSTGDFAGAREAASQGLSRYPDDPGLLMMLGEALAADPATKAEAIRHFERLTAVEPENNQAAVRLARLYLELGDLNASQRILEKELARNAGLCPGRSYPGADESLGRCLWGGRPKLSSGS